LKFSQPLLTVIYMAVCVVRNDKHYWLLHKPQNTAGLEHNALTQFRIQCLASVLRDTQY